MSIVLSASVACIQAVAIRPIAELHGVSPDIAVAWVRKITPVSIKDNNPGDFPTREGAVVFLISDVPEYRVVVQVQVQRIMRIDDSETWIGRYVSCSVPGLTWLWGYHLDWKTNQIVEPQIKLGNYPYDYLNLSFLT